jgi:hypothetical protein
MGEKMKLVLGLFIEKIFEIFFRKILEAYFE